MPKKRFRRSKGVKKSASLYESKIEEDFGCYWKHNYTFPLTLQHKFHKSREWRFDFAFPQVFLAVEIQGFGTGHTSYTGMHKDYEKHNAAVKCGWSIIYLMSVDVATISIRKTCNEIHKLVLARSLNPKLIECLKEISNGEGRSSGLLEGDRGCNDNFEALRSKLHKKFD